MKNQTLIVSSAPRKILRYVFTEDDQRLEIPDGWQCLEPGDAAVTRELKKLGPSWTAQTKKGRKTFSDGVWAPIENIERAREIVEAKRMTPEHQRKLEADRQRRARKQERYVEEFRAAVIDYLAFHPRYSDLAIEMARVITDHATPVGSGTVARTERIPLNKRAGSAVTAWMRHQTTRYDRMSIARVRGKRREVRADLAQESRRLLGAYRSGEDIDKETCRLYKALKA